MEKNNTSRKVLRIIGSILVAIALWIYVDTVTSPEVTLKVKNVPVEFSGEDTTLADRGLMLLSGYDTTELEDGYMEVSVLLYYPEEREELPEMPELYHSDGISPPLTMDPPDGGDLWRLNYHISTQDTSWLMVEFTDSDDTEYDVILE